MTKTNKYSIFNSRDFIPQSRKYECTNGAQTLVVWAFSNFVENLRTTISKKSIIILEWKMDRIIHKTVCTILTNFWAYIVLQKWQHGNRVTSVAFLLPIFRKSSIAPIEWFLKNKVKRVEEMQSERVFKRYLCEI